MLKGLDTLKCRCLATNTTTMSTYLNAIAVYSDAIRRSSKKHPVQESQTKRESNSEKRQSGQPVPLGK